MIETKVLHPDIYTIEDFLTADECAALIAESEAARYEEATVATRSGPVLAKGVRNNDRVITDDVERADRLWIRLRSVFPTTYRNRYEAVGLNERFRFYRYGPGQVFRWHRDGAYLRDDGSESIFTFMIYLNEGCQGGETMFRGLAFGYVGEEQAPQEVAVRPKTGTALLFAHPLDHTGAMVTGGLKYVLRSDVMYRDIAAGHASVGQAPA